MSPPVFYLEGTVGWTDAFKRACRKTEMTKLGYWYSELDWRVSDEFDGELGEWLIWFNAKYPDDLQEIRSEINDIKDKLTRDSRKQHSVLWNRKVTIFCGEMPYD